jgi:hypothetical protein
VSILPTVSFLRKGEKGMSMLFNKDCFDEYGIGRQYRSCDFYNNPMCSEIVLHLKADKGEGEFNFHANHELPGTFKLHTLKGFKRHKIPISCGYTFYVRRNPNIPEVLFIPLSERSLLIPGRRTIPMFELVGPGSPDECSPDKPSFAARYLGQHVGQR